MGFDKGIKNELKRIADTFELLVKHLKEQKKVKK